MSDVILLRTHYYDHALDRFVYRLLNQTGRRVVVVADERRGTVDCPPGLDKLVLDPQALGLFVTQDTGWRCGDYALYAALAALPEATAFWLIEPDVRIHSAELKSFFDGLDDGIDPDFLTAWFTVSSPEWAWHATIRPFAKDVYNCMLQLSRFSRTSVEYLLSRRVALGDVFAANRSDPQTWPNDEAFVGATLMEGGFSIGTLKRHAPLFRTDGTFGFTKPTSQGWLDRRPEDQHIYHPVVGGRKFLQRAHAYLAEMAMSAPSPAAIVTEFGADFLSQVDIECGKPAAARFYHQVMQAAIRCDDRVSA